MTPESLQAPAGPGGTSPGARGPRPGRHDAPAWSQETIHWIKRELTASIADARNLLERFAEDRESLDLMRRFANLMHTAAGALRMVDIHGATLLVEEMEAVALGIEGGTLLDADDGLDALTRSVVQLPAYVERVAAGERDLPLLLLPLLNDLRAVRGSPLLSESTLFILNVPAESIPEQYGGKAASENIRQAVRKLHPHFQASLLGFLRNRDSSRGLSRMNVIAESVIELTQVSALAQLFWVVCAVIEALQDGGLPAGASIKRLMGQVERQLRVVVVEGDEVFEGRPAEELLSNLLYYVARATSNGERVNAVKKAFALEELLPAGEELDSARADLGGPSAELMDTVGEAIRSDLNRIKQALEAHLARADVTDVEGLAVNAEQFKKISDTLRVLGLGDLSLQLDGQRDALDAIVAAGQAEAEELLSVAAALLEIEDRLEEALTAQSLSRRAGADEDEGNQELQKVVAAAARESIVTLEEIKDILGRFSRDPRDRADLGRLGPLLHGVGGALEVLERRAAAALVARLQRVVEGPLLQADTPSDNDLDRLADALIGLEYYLETIGAGRPDPLYMLENADFCLDVLDPDGQGWLARATAGAPTPSGSAGETAADAARAPAAPAAPAHASREQRSAPTGEAAADAEARARDVAHTAAAAVPAEHADAPASPVEARAPEAAPASTPAATPVAAPLSAATEGAGASATPAHLSRAAPPAHVPVAPPAPDAPALDPELLELFLEEAREEQALIAGHLAAWRDGAESQTALSELRRSFHTLKGSARMVGATAMGEFAWGLENLFNGFVNGRFPIDAQRRAYVEEAMAALPLFLEPLAQGRQIGGEARALIRRGAVLGDLPVPELALEPAAAGAATPPAAHEAGAPAGEEESSAPDREGETAPGGDLPGLLELRDAAAGAPPAQVAQGGPASTSGSPSGADPSPPLLPRPLAQTPPALVAALERVRSLTNEAVATAGAAVPIDEALVHAWQDVEHGASGAGLEPLERLAESSWRYLAAGARAGHVLPAAAVEWLIEASVRCSAWLDEGRAGGTVAGDAFDGLLERLYALPEPQAPRSEAPVSEAPVSETPVSETPVSETPVSETPVSETPVSETPPANTPAAAGDAADASEASEASQASGIAEAAAAAPAAPERPSAVAPPATGMSGGGGPELAPSPAADSPAAPEMPAFDSTLVEIFTEEAAELLEQADASLEHWRGDSAGAGAALDELKRVLHTLKGGARMAGITPIGDVSHELESLLLRMDTTDPAQREGMLSLVQSTVDSLHGLRDALVAGTSLAGAERALALIRGEAGDAPPVVPDHGIDAGDTGPTGPAGAPRGDDALAGAAAGGPAETADHPALTPSDACVAPAPRRTGGAGRADGAAADPAVDGAGADGGAADGAARDGAAVEGGEGAALEGADATAPRGGATAADTATSAESDADAARPSAAGADGAAAAPRGLLERLGQPQEGAGADGAERRETLRIPAELLDDLLSSAGEISIVRSRLEQKVHALGFNVNELEQTVERLRTQLRKLELETETQLLFRHRDDEGEQPEPARGDFDPLELDRYSTIQQLSRALAECVGDLSSLRDMQASLQQEAENLLVQQARTTAELQDGLMRSRMIPFARRTQRLTRIVRQTAAEAGKAVDLHITGADGELDRQILDRTLPPLEHMLRNAVVHGVETPDERRARGKPERATISLRLRREGAQMVIELSDDGAGLNVPAIRERALARGLISAHEERSERELMELIFEPGFSTATQVTQAAGRGVGMDVVASEVRKLGGLLDFDSVAGEGTTFEIRLPFTLAIAQTLLVQAGGEGYAIPLPAVEGILRLPTPEVERHLEEAGPVYEYGGINYRFAVLAQLLGNEIASVPETTTTPVILVRAGERSTALVVDEINGNREVVVKSAGPQIAAIRGVSGATVLGDGSLRLILDVGALVRGGAVRSAAADELPPAEQHKPLALVVDDSITVRRATSRLLERNGVRVLTARDGIDAVAVMEEHLPDVLLLDIEMPRMDGYELVAHMRKQERLRGIPIVMITSRVGEKHRAHGLALGVNDYLGKPYQEAQLLTALEPFLRRRGGA